MVMQQAGRQARQRMDDTHAAGLPACLPAPGGASERAKAKVRSCKISCAQIEPILFANERSGEADASRCEEKSKN